MAYLMFKWEILQLSRKLFVELKRCNRMYCSLLLIKQFKAVNALKGSVECKIPIPPKIIWHRLIKFILHAVSVLINSWAVAQFVSAAILLFLSKFNCFSISDNLLRLILDCQETVPVWSGVLFSSLCLVLAVQLSGFGVQKNETGLKTYLPFFSCCGLISKESIPSSINALQTLLPSFLLIPLLSAIILYYLI